ncbi:MAG TPA: GNAT family N-acetyltransferase [Acidobacteriaceae bacterium]|nr:GNAT family N-acetyltransferase [Acidobacteriaceae bacterium]
MKDDVHIRPIRPKDSAAAAQLAAQLGYARTAEQICDWVQQLDGRTDRAAFIAEVNGEVVGWVEVSLAHHLQSDPSGLIGGLVVKEALRGAGIGRRLCEEAERWTLEQGVNQIRVTSRSTREAAHRFYLRDGYRQVKLSMVFEKTLAP